MNSFPLHMFGYFMRTTPAIDMSDSHAKAALWKFWLSLLDKADLTHNIRLCVCVHVCMHVCVCDHVYQVLVLTKILDDVVGCRSCI